MQATNRVPVWSLCLLFFSLAALVVEWRSRAAGERDAETLRLLPELEEQQPLDPATAPTRSLRILPGIGTRRAMAVTATRWRNGPGGGSLPWQAVHGIGPHTAGEVTDWLQDRGVPHPELIERPGTP